MIIEPLISVIVPVYKSEKYLERCLNSILNQTYKNLEVILILNTNANDNCPKICEKYKINYNNVIMIHQADNGPSSARNAGIEIANGDYYCFIDSDDFADPNMISMLKSGVEKNELMLSMCKHVRYPNHKKNESRPSDIKIITKNDAEVFNLMLDDQEFCAPWAKLYSATLFENLRFPVTRNEDMFIMPEIIRRAKRIAFCDEVLYFYSQEGPSLVRSKYNHDSILSYYKANGYWKNFADKYYPHLARKAEAFYFRNLIDICREIRDDRDPEIKKLLSEYKNIIKNNVTKLIFTRLIRLKEKIKIFLLYIA